VSNSIARPRLYAVLMGVFASVAVILAGVGIYGVVSWSVTQRTREIGIRVVLGARRADVMRLILTQSGTLVGLGITAGLGGAALLSRYLRGMLFGLTPLDLPTFAGVALALAAMAMLASWAPARRATRVDPLIAIREA
jgi:putative ABC transport system permease protein